MSRLLTAAELVGVTSADPSLSPEQMRQVVRWMYGRERKARVLAGDPPRAANWGSFGAYGPSDRYFRAAMSDRTGIWIRVTERTSARAIGAGHVSWAVAEAQLAPVYEQSTLFGQA